MSRKLYCPSWGFTRLHPDAGKKSLFFLETNTSEAPLVRVNTVIWDLCGFYKRFSCQRTDAYGPGKLHSSSYVLQKALWIQSLQSENHTAVKSREKCKTRSHIGMLYIFSQGAGMHFHVPLAWDSGQGNRQVPVCSCLCADTCICKAAWRLCSSAPFKLHVLTS